MIRQKVTGHPRPRATWLVHELVSAIAENRIPAINPWEAGRTVAMGVAAHQSALKDDEILAVPDRATRLSHCRAAEW